LAFHPRPRPRFPIGCQALDPDSTSYSHFFPSSRSIPPLSCKRLFCYSFCFLFFVSLEKLTHTNRRRYGTLFNFVRFLSLSHCVPVSIAFSLFSLRLFRWSLFPCCYLSGSSLVDIPYTLLTYVFVLPPRIRRLTTSSRIRKCPLSSFGRPAFVFAGVLCLELRFDSIMPSPFFLHSVLAFFVQRLPPKPLTSELDIGGRGEPYAFARGY